MGLRSALIDAGMALEAQDLVQQLGAEAVQHRHHDDERRNTQQDAEEGEERNHRDEAFPPPGAEIAHRQHPLEGREGLGVWQAFVHQAVKRARMPSSGTLLALTRLAVLDLGHALLQAARSDDHLPGQADQVHHCKLGPWTIVAIVIEDVDALGLECLVEFLAGGVSVGIAHLEVDEADAGKAPPAPAR